MMLPASHPLHARLIVGARSCMDGQIASRASGRYGSIWILDTGSVHVAQGSYRHHITASSDTICIRSFDSCSNLVIQIDITVADGCVDTHCASTSQLSSSTQHIERAADVLDTVAQQLKLHLA